MDKKSKQILEYPKVLENLAGYCAFQGSKEKALALEPTTNLEKAEHQQQETAEAFDLLSIQPNTTIGGARDIRESLEAAKRQVILEPTHILDIKYTLVAARNLYRVISRREHEYPILWESSLQLPPPVGLVDKITKTLSERGEILDTASIKLSNIRKELHTQHDRLLSRLQRMISDPKIAPYLQENLITQRDGRYVIPLRSDFKGKVKAVVHDQSSSGATVYVEPLSIVEMNNDYRELQLAERDEERKILADLTREIGEHANVLFGIVDALANLDLAFAKARYAEDINAFQPILRPIRPRKDSRHPGVTIRLIQARHPLLDQKTVVPINVELDPQTFMLVITGPNTGGKTVTLKTIGLLALMAQSGLHIPAQSGSEISVFSDIFADIGDEQSIEQSLSTFSGHITNIIHILKNVNRLCLVLLDELGAGTDPQEGAALARALLNHLLERGITTIVTTHHPELKTFAHATPGIVNASVEFDLNTLKPTYHLTIGLPGRSNALAIAERLGLPEDIISHARSELNPLDLHADNLLDEIYRQRDLAQEARVEAEEYRNDSLALHRKLASQLENIEEERAQLLEEAREGARKEVQDIKDELKRLRKEMQRARQPLNVLKTIEERVSEIEEHVAEPVVRREQDNFDLSISEPLRIGSRVRLRSLNAEGIITALSEDEAEVQVGMLRVRAQISDLESKGSSALTPLEDKNMIPEREIITPKRDSPGIELDLRGQRVDEALEVLENYLEKAYLAGLPWVRIIHGKGTGKLRDAVRQALTNHPYVKSFESGKAGEGGEGVTIAKIKT
ncbi:MAG TPA: endonuclease MutS2 [Anaerolineae bacterium]|nr:endonuclease MutS2 [Anaerolineae bacterium]